MRTVFLTTWNHLGDTVALTGAIHNVKMAHPDAFDFRFVGQYRKVFIGNRECCTDYQMPSERSALLVGYGTREDESNGIFGNWVSGFTHSLCKGLGIDDVPLATTRGILHTYKEADDKMATYRGWVLLNANAQDRSQVKFYPYWNEVVKHLRSKGLKVAQVGSNQRINITQEIECDADLRGKTESLQDYFALVKNCRFVLTPPSGIIHIAGAFGVGGVVVNGAREPSVLTEYDGVLHATSKSCSFDGHKNGCISFSPFPADERPCWRPILCGSTWTASCMAEVSPKKVIALCEQML